MLLGYLVLLTALTISSVAIYYSVAGLVAIFAAAAIPIIIMGTVLEIAKLVTTVWLHRYWDQAVWWLKTYLSLAVIVLMLITSMGIFGYLSKAHIEQTAKATEGLAVLEQIDAQITRQTDISAVAKSKIVDLESTGTNSDADIQSQIDREQTRIDSAYSRIQPAIDEQNTIIAKEEQRLGGSLTLYQDQITKIESDLQKVESLIASDDIRALQALVGVEADGNLGPATTRAIEAFRSAQNIEKQRLSELIASESSKISSPVIDAARTEIQRLRSLAEKEIADSNALISRLRAQIGTVNTDQITSEVTKQNTIIDKAEQEIAKLSEQKFNLESEYRKLEAEVGPIKYLAEFVYGNETNKDMLEEAVRWVIMLIIFVFDPLAVLLLIASQYTFNAQRKVTVSEPPPPPKRRNNRKTTAPVTESATGSAPVKAVRRRKIKDILVDPIPSVTQEPAESVDEQDRAALLAATEELDNWKAAKKRWKDENPDLNLKAFKDDYVRGRIDELPWAVYVEDGTYVQNSEQSNDNTLWKRIRERNNGSNNSNNSTGQAV